VLEVAEVEFWNLVSLATCGDKRGYFSNSRLDEAYARPGWSRGKRQSRWLRDGKASRKGIRDAKNAGDGKGKTKKERV